MQPNSEWQHSTTATANYHFKKAWRRSESSMAMARLPAMRLAVVVALTLWSCLIHAADASSPPGLKAMQQDTRVAPPSSCGGVADDQAAVVAGEAAGGRMDLELQDYPGSGANDRHSPWAQERRN